VGEQAHHTETNNDPVSFQECGTKKTHCKQVRKNNKDNHKYDHKFQHGNHGSDTQEIKQIAGIGNPAWRSEASRITRSLCGTKKRDTPRNMYARGEPQRIRRAAMELKQNNTNLQSAG
jgi:hypothetical protein